MMAAESRIWTEAMRIHRRRWEDALATLMELAGVPMPKREYRFDPKRRSRFDFAWPDLRLAVEVEGGSWTQGRHTRGLGFSNDMEKYNRAALQGWIVLRYGPQEVKSGRAVGQILEAIEAQQNAQQRQVKP